MLSNYIAWSWSLDFAQRQAVIGVLLLVAVYLIEVLLKRRLRRRKERKA